MALDDARAASGGRGQPSTSDTGTATVDVVAESLSALARELEEHHDPDAVLAATVNAAIALITGAEDGSISVAVGRRRVRSAAPTSDLPRLVDAVQEEVQQGPCLDAVSQQQTVRVTDMTTEPRWPLFTRRAAKLGVGSMLSLQLYVTGDTLGALTLYASTPGAFDDDSEQIGLLVATHAAIAYVGARNQKNAADALIHRDVIGQAKGILIERYQISGDRAFVLLSQISQNSNQKLHHIAAELVETGTITGTHGLPPTSP